MEYKPELILDSKCVLAEVPLFDDKTKRLYFIDILGCKLFCLDTLTNKVDVMDVGKNIGTIVFCQDGRLIAALRDGFYYVDFDKKELEFICNPEEDLPNNRYNDGKIDPRGNFIVGSISTNWDRGCGTDDLLAKLYSMDASGKVTILDSDVLTPNGLAWSSDNKTMYLVDTGRFVVYAYDYDINTGILSNRRNAIEIPDGYGYPDGMTIDNEDMIWVCQWGGSAVHRWNPNTGELLDTVKIPVSQPTCCIFAGDNMDEMYITSASIGAEDEAGAGGILKVKMNVKGKAPYIFA